MDMTSSPDNDVYVVKDLWNSEGSINFSGAHDGISNAVYYEIVILMLGTPFKLDLNL